ncbi:MAG: sulfatase-like hydrolase/transferase [Verrucomicrobia bacterium]|nr:sulfatase-like hydrolase/transferase [Verrucomicrobiota bacterium]MCH8512554.1 sulfatase-like hydrolase/transferase [Kiritimatiellia bacterium]
MSSRPNFLVFFTDQQRWDTLGLNGVCPGLTPHFDRLARQGTFFRQAVTPQPVCGPARSCLQTGQYATTTGVWKNGPGLKADSPRLAELFNQAGYHTGYIGKWHLSEKTGEGPVPRENRGGYRDWLGANCVELVSGPYNSVLWDEEDKEVRLPGYRVDAQVDASIRWLTERAASPTQPFLLFHSLLEPHHQNTSDSDPAPRGVENLVRHIPPPPDLQALGGTTAQHWPGYCGMIRRIDEALGRTMDALESLGLADNTVVVFLSDHGCHFKTRNAEYKRSPHESSVRVPFAFWGPGWNGGGQREECVSLVDLMPSLLDSAGIEIPPEVQGRSLKPLTRNPTEPWPEDSLIQFGDSWLPPGRALRTPRWKYAVTAPEQFAGPPHAPRYEETHLYDLQNDPYELSNLVHLSVYRPVTATLRARLLERMAEIGEAETEIVSTDANHSSGQRTVDDPGGSGPAAD